MPLVLEACPKAESTGLPLGKVRQVLWPVGTVGTHADRGYLLGWQERPSAPGAGAQFPAASSSHLDRCRAISSNFGV